MEELEKYRDFMTALLAISTTLFAAVASGGEIKLLFPKIELEEKAIKNGPKEYVASPMKGRGGKPVYIEKGISELLNEFKKAKYKVDQIELWISGWEESAGITRLLISLEGEGGLRILLKPKD